MLFAAAHESVSVKVFGCRPHDDGAAYSGAGVRKPPKEEIAGRGTWEVRRALSRIESCTQLRLRSQVIKGCRPRIRAQLWTLLRRKCGTFKTGQRLLLSPIAHHRHYGRAVWIDPVVLRAITISWNNI